MRTVAHSLTAWLLFVGVLVAYTVMAVWYPVAYIWATYEDLYGEWAQTFFFALAFLFSIAITLDRPKQRWFFLLLAAACFYVVMEEISWGQRIFGFDTPEFLKRHNLQHETNIHNLFTGPLDTWTKRALEYLMAAGFVGYGLVYTLLIRRSGDWLRRFESDWLPAPPLYLWPFFVTAAFLELGYLNFNEAEIAEILIGAGMAMLCGHYWLTNRDGLDAHHPLAWSAGASLRLAMLFIGLFGLTGVLSATTTRILNSDPVIKAETDNRLLNGYEKFADRYARYERWPEAIDLYQKVHQAEPARTSVMRRLADVYRKNGDINGFNRYNQLSLDTLLTMQAENPTKVSTNLALSLTYRQRGIAAKSIEHLRRAHEIAKQRYALQPDSANNAYWLAKTYKEMGGRSQAVEYFRRAFELEPNSKKYRKAYYAMRAYEASDDE